MPAACWAIGLSGTDADLFNIVAATGAVTFKAAPNYEAPDDAGGNNVYNITVTASDGVNTSAAQAVAITVTNVDATVNVAVTAGLITTPLNFGLSTNGSIDGAQSVYLIPVDGFASAVGQDVLTWSFASGNFGGDRSITPLLFEKVGEDYVLRAIGTTQQAQGNTVYQDLPFNVLVGDASIKNADYIFGWKDGTQTQDNEGVIANVSGSPGLWISRQQGQAITEQNINLPVDFSVRYDTTNGGRDYQFSVNTGIIKDLPLVTEGNAAQLFYTFTRSGDIDGALTVSFEKGGTATADDYAPSLSEITFAAGSSTATLALSARADRLTDIDETLTVTVIPGQGYNLGLSASATGTIQDKPPTVSTITESTSAAVTKDPITFTVTFSEALTGTVGTSNFTASSGSVTSVARVDTSNVYTVVVTPAAGVASGSVALSLVGTGLADAAGNKVADADLSGLATQVIDTNAPVATFTAVKNSLGGVLSAGLTNSASLELSGSNEAGASVSVYNGSTLLGQAVVTGTNWTYSVTTTNGITYDLQAQETDAAGNVGPLKTYFAGAGDAVIDLGAGNGQLIAPVQVDGGKWFYHWDVSGDGTAFDKHANEYSADHVLGWQLHDIFNKDVNGVQGPGTSETYRYATLNGIHLALPTIGLKDDVVATFNIDGSVATLVGTDYEVTGISGIAYTEQAGTAIGSLNPSEGDNTINPLYDDLLAIWDAYNGNGITESWRYNQFGTGWGDKPNISGMPTGWHSQGSPSYASASHNYVLGWKAFERHYELDLSSGTISGNGEGERDSDSNKFMVALQVLGRSVIVVDTLAPTLAISSDKEALKAGETATITFTFSENPGTSFSGSDVRVGGGTLGLLSGSGLVRTATFTPAENFTGNTSITVGPLSQADLVFTATKADNTSFVDTIDIGVTLTRGAGGPMTASTYNNSPTLTWNSQGWDNLSEVTSRTFTTFALALNNNAGNVILASNLVAHDVLNDKYYTFDFTQYTGGGTGGGFSYIRTLIDNTNSEYTDAAGNIGLASKSATLNIDTLAPTVSISSSANSLGEGETATITFTFSEDPGDAFSSANVQVIGGELGDISGTGLVRTAVFTPATTEEDSTAAISIVSGSYGDAAGNPGQASNTAELAVAGSLLLPQSIDENTPAGAVIYNAASEAPLNTVSYVFRINTIAFGDQVTAEIPDTSGRNNTQFRGMDYVDEIVPGVGLTRDLTRPAYSVTVRWNADGWEDLSDLSGRNYVHRMDQSGADPGTTDWVMHDIMQDAYYKVSTDDDFASYTLLRVDPSDGAAWVDPFTEAVSLEQTVDTELAPEYAVSVGVKLIVESGKLNALPTIEWNFDGWGDLSDVANREYDADGLNGKAIGFRDNDYITNNEAVMHDIVNDTYYKVDVAAWSGGSNYHSWGGVSYTRALIEFDEEDQVTLGERFIVEIPDGRVLDELSEGVQLMRGWGGSLYASQSVAWNVQGWDDLTNVADRAYTTSMRALFSYEGLGNEVLNAQLVMRDRVNDTYYKVDFSSWTSGGGGGFAYERRQINADGSTGEPVLFTHADYSDTVDVIAPGVIVTRGLSKPLDSSPIRWNADGWDNLEGFSSRSFHPSMESALGETNGVGSEFEGTEWVMQDLSTGKYYKVNLTHWQQGGGGGVAYERSEILATGYSYIDEFIDKSGNPILSIDQQTGLVTLNENPDYELQPIYEFTVYALNEEDEATPLNASIAVNNLDEIAPEITSDSAISLTTSDLTSGDVFYTAQADDSADISGGVTFGFFAGSVSVDEESTVTAEIPDTLGGRSAVQFRGMDYVDEIVPGVGLTRDLTRPAYSVTVRWNADGWEDLSDLSGRNYVHRMDQSGADPGTTDWVMHDIMQDAYYKVSTDDDFASYTLLRVDPSDGAAWVDPFTEAVSLEQTVDTELAPEYAVSVGVKLIVESGKLNALPTIEWNFDGWGDLSDVANREYDADGLNGKAIGFRDNDYITNNEAVMHDIVNDTYYKVDVAAWSGGSNYHSWGGVSYTRALIEFDEEDQVTLGERFIVEIPDGRVLDELSEGVQLMRGWGGSLYASQSVAWNVQGWDDLTNVADRAYTTSMRALFSYEGLGNEVLNAQLVMRDRVNDTYYKVDFSSWTSGGGGGFAYERRQINADGSTGEPVLFTHADYSDTVDVIAPGVIVTRGLSKPLDSSPIRWNADGWDNLEGFSSRSFHPSMESALGETNGVGSEFEGTEWVMQDLSTGKYYKVNLTHWQQGGGGGVAYERSELVFNNGLIEGSDIAIINAMPLVSKSGDFVIDPITGEVTYVGDLSGWDGTSDLSFTLAAQDAAGNRTIKKINLDFVVPSVINVTVSPARVAEGDAANLVYTFTRSGGDFDGELTVNIGMGGTATAEDYASNGPLEKSWSRLVGFVTEFSPSSLPTVTFASGSTTATLTLKATADQLTEGDETVTVTVLAGQGYEVGTNLEATGIIEDNLPPAITSANTANVAEGITDTVYTVIAEDPNVGSTLDYALDGTDAGLFSISSTGAVTFKAAPNFEAPLDDDGDNVYNITVTASDGVNALATQAVAITVNDVTATVNVAVTAGLNNTPINFGLDKNGSTDGYQSVYLIPVDGFASAIGQDVLSWSFASGSFDGNRSITPLLFEKVSNDYVLRAIGSTQQTQGNTVYQDLAFNVLAGDATIANANYVFGWKDGTQTLDNAGVISIVDGSPGYWTSQDSNGQDITDTVVGEIVPFRDRYDGRNYQFSVNTGIIKDLPVVTEGDAAQLMYTFTRSGDIDGELTVDITLTGTATTSDYAPSPFNKDWSRLLGGSVTDFLCSIATTSDGGFYAVGQATDYSNDNPMTSADSVPLTHFGNADAFISKYDSLGIQQWARVYGGANDDAATSVVVGSDGSAYIAGYGNGTDGANGTFIAKYLPTGALDTTWELTDVSPSGWDNRSIILTPDESAVLILSNSNGQGSYLTKVLVEADGSPGTAASFTVPNRVATAIATTSDGLVYLTGYTQSNIDGQTLGGQADAFISQLDATGAVVWSRLIGGAADESGTSVVVGPDGAVYVAGGSYSHIFLNKFDSNGNTVWEQTIANGVGAESSNNPCSLVIGSDGFVYLSGTTTQAMGDQVSLGSNDAFISRINPSNGEMTLTHIVGSAGDDRPRAIAAGPDGEIFIGGFTFNNNGVYDNLPEGLGDVDGFVTKFSSPSLSQVTFAAGSTTAKLVIQAQTDQLPNEGNESLTVTVEEGQGYSLGSSASATGTIEDNRPPVITSAETASAAENTTGAVYTVTATDANVGSTLAYALDGTDADLFSISSTGVVTFKAAPNFEAPTDDVSDNVYNITVTASDGVNTSAAQAVEIEVTNVGEAGESVIDLGSYGQLIAPVQVQVMAAP
jgi:hypothetical protein